MFVRVRYERKENKQKMLLSRGAKSSLLDAEGRPKLYGTLLHYLNPDIQRSDTAVENNGTSPASVVSSAASKTKPRECMDSDSVSFDAR